MKRSNNKILFIVLMVLIGGFVLTRVFRAPSRERNLEENLLALDTARISSIYISPAIEKKKEIRLIRSGNEWQIQQEERNGQPDINLVRNALGSLAAIHADRVLTRNNEKWSSYHVDTTGTHVKVFLGQNVAKEFWIGKIDGGGSSIRVEGESDVYASKESLDGKFNKNFNEWRDKTFLKMQTENISKITFQYQGDSSFVLSQLGSKWEIGNAKADSSKVQTYLNKLRYRTLQDFADDFTPMVKPRYTITLHGHSASPITVQGWKVQEDQWVLHSSQQKDVYFSSHDASVIGDLFVGRKMLLTRTSEP